MSEPTPDELVRAVTALIAFVRRWHLSVNPEDLEELAYAVPHHARSDAPPEQIVAAVEQQIAAQPGRCRAGAPSRTTSPRGRSVLVTDAVRRQRRRARLRAGGSPQVDLARSGPRSATRVWVCAGPGGLWLSRRRTRCGSSPARG
jgi:hypothetical protein